MNNVGVLKTKNESTIFNNQLSWFIYTPTENLRIVKKIRTFDTLYSLYPISHPISLNPTKINTFTNHTTHFQTHNPNHFLPI